MLDLYQVLVPVFTIIAVANLLYLKLAVRDNTLQLEIAERSISCEGEEDSNAERSAVGRSLRFLMRNFTLVEWCAVGRGKYKLSLLLSLSLISIAAFYISSPLYLSFTGTAVYFTYFLITMAAVGRGEGDQAQGKVHREKYLQVLYSVLSLSINFVMIALLFKNYRNSELRTFIANCGVNIALDNFAVRPVAIIILGTLLSRSERYMQFVEQQERSVKLIEFYQKMKGKEQLNKPIGKMYSPSRLPKCVPVNLEIEPVPVEREASNKDDFDNASKQLYQIRAPQMENLERSLQLLRKLKKEKSAPPLLATPHRHRFQDSQNSLLNSTNKDPSSPSASKRFSQNDEPQRYSQKVIQHTDPLPNSDPAINLNEDGPCAYQQRKFGSQHVIMINPSRQEPVEVENEQDQPTNEELVRPKNEELLRRVTTEGSIEEEHFDFTKKATINLEDEINNPVRINLNGSSGPSSRNEPLRICLNGEEHHFANNEYHEEDIESDRYRRRRDTLNPDENTTPAKNTLGVLQIKENHRCEEIEELDLNSPERRRQATRKQEETSRLQVKKKKKKLSHDERNRVVRFTTGEPYLEYLPNMLNKEGSKKKMQAKKELVIDSRLGKKQKRRDFNFENNENVVPSFRIEEY